MFLVAEAQGVQRKWGLAARAGTLQSAPGPGAPGSPARPFPEASLEVPLKHRLGLRPGARSRGAGAAVQLACEGGVCWGVRAIREKTGPYCRNNVAPYTQPKECGSAHGRHRTTGRAHSALRERSRTRARRPSPPRRRGCGSAFRERLAGLRAAVSRRPARSAGGRGPAGRAVRRTPCGPDSSSARSAAGARPAPACTAGCAWTGTSPPRCGAGPPAVR